MRHFAFNRAVAILAFASTLGLSACSKDEPVPYYQLTEVQRAWAAPYKADTQWRFRSTRGTERTYRVQHFSDEKLANKGRKGKTESYTDVFVANFYRADTVSSPRASFLTSGQMGSSLSPVKFDIEGSFLTLPIEQLAAQQPLPAGYEFLSHFTTSTGAYLGVLHYTSSARTSEVFYTKEQGVVRFVEKGIVWDRL